MQTRICSRESLTCQMLAGRGSGDVILGSRRVLRQLPVDADNVTKSTFSRFLTEPPLPAHGADVPLNKFGIRVVRPIVKLVFAEVVVPDISWVESHPSTAPLVSKVPNFVLRQCDQRLGICLSTSKSDKTGSGLEVVKYWIQLLLRLILI